MPNKRRTEYFEGHEILLEDLAHDQQGRQDSDYSLFKDLWTDGIIKDPNGLSNGDITVDGTTATLINIGWVTGYANGRRIAIDSNKDYDANAPFSTTNGICTPQSSGNRGVPLANYTRGQSNFIWAEFLEVLRTNPLAIASHDGAKHYPHADDGYRIRVTTTNPPGNPTGISNSIFLGTVFGQGASTSLVASPTGITDSGRQYAEIRAKDSVGTEDLKDGSVTPQKLASGLNFNVTSACFSTLVASSNVTVPIQPLEPTSAASKKFAQYAGFGIAVSKTVFRYTYDGFYRLIRVSVEGDSTGSITPTYDGLCNVTRLTETIDSRTVTHEFTWASQDGASLISATTENGV